MANLRALINHTSAGKATFFTPHCVTAEINWTPHNYTKELKWDVFADWCQLVSIIAGEQPAYIIIIRSDFAIVLRGKSGQVESSKVCLLTVQYEARTFVSHYILKILIHAHVHTVDVVIRNWLKLCALWVVRRLCYVSSLTPRCRRSQSSMGTAGDIQLFSCTRNGTKHTTLVRESLQSRGLWFQRD